MRRSDRRATTAAAAVIRRSTAAVLVFIALVVLTTKPSSRSHHLASVCNKPARTTGRRQNFGRRFIFLVKTLWWNIVTCESYFKWLPGNRTRQDFLQIVYRRSKVLIRGEIRKKKDKKKLLPSVALYEIDYRDRIGVKIGGVISWWLSSRLGEKIFDILHRFPVVWFLDSSSIVLLRMTMGSWVRCKWF